MTLIDPSYLRLEKKFNRARKNWMRLTTHEKRNDKWWREMKRIIKRSQKLPQFFNLKLKPRYPVKRKRTLTNLTFTA